MITKSTEVSKQRKNIMYQKTKDYFNTYQNYMLVSIQKVDSNQFKNIAKSFPEDVKILFAKNKIMIKVLKELGEDKYKNIIDSLKGNVLLVFYDKTNPKAILDVSQNNLRQAYAVVGDIAKKDVIISAGPTGLPPEKINLFQNLRMTTKINKGKIDLALDHVIVKQGERVGVAEANILNMLNIMPFEYGLDILKIYEGNETYTKDVLLIDEEVIESQIKECISTIAAISLGTNIVTEASLSYEINNAFDEVVKMSLGLGINIEN